MVFSMPRQYAFAVTLELKQQLRGVLWSNANAPEQAYVRAALLRPRFHLILAIALELGLDRVTAEWDFLKAYGGDRTERVAGPVERMIGNIGEGFRHAAN